MHKARIARTSERAAQDAEDVNSCGVDELALVVGFVVVADEEDEPVDEAATEEEEEEVLEVVAPDTEELVVVPATILVFRLFFF